MSLSLKLSIRGPAAAEKTSKLQVALNITSNGGKAVNGTLQFNLKDVISNDVMKSKTTKEISIPASGFSQNFNVGDFFDTPKTGAYLLTASVNGNTSNELPIKILL
jgi:hypothetical protein